MPTAKHDEVFDGPQTTSTEGNAEMPDSVAQEDSGFVLPRVFSYTRPFDRFLLVVAALAAIGAGTATALVNLVMGRLISVLTEFTSGSMSHDDFQSDVSKYALFFVYIGISQLALTYIYSTLFTYVAYYITRNVRHNYIRSALSQDIAYFDTEGGGLVPVRVISGGKLIQSGIADKLGIVLQSLSTFFAAFIVAMVKQWKLTLIISCIIPALLLVMGTASAFDSKIEAKTSKLLAEAGTYAEKVLAGVRTIHAFNAQSESVQKYASYLSSAKTLGYKKNFIYGVFFSGQYFIVYAAMGLAFWQGLTMISRGEVDNFGTIFTVLFSVVIASSSITSIAPHSIAFIQANTAAAELFSLIDRKANRNPFDESGEKPSDPSGVIELQNIKFQYPSRPDVSVLQDFTLHVPAGKVTALVGASGSGKSTIVGLLERWYDPSSGKTTLDGCPIDQLNLKWLRTNIRLVSQEPTLFNGTIFENIAFGLVGTPFENESLLEKTQRVERAAEIAYASDFISKLPNGYDTNVGERGKFLSGGQKQRIAIARSVISEPKVLLLDEATSALDPESEGLVQKALNEASQSRTTIVIAHKLSTIYDADNIVVMSKGRITEQGTHAELVAQNGAYYNLVKAQDLGVAEIKEKGSDQESQSVKTEVDWAADALLPEPEAASTQGKDDDEDFEDVSIFKNLYKLMAASGRLRWLYLFQFIGCLLGAALYPGQALLLGNMMDSPSTSNMVKRGNFVALMYFVMSLGCLVVYFCLGWVANIIAQNLSYTTRRGIFEAFLRQDMQFFDKPVNTVGALVSHLTSMPQSIFELMGFTLILIVVSIVSILSCSILSIVTSWKLGLVGVFAALPPMLFAGYARIHIESRLDKDTDKRFANSASIVSEMISEIRTVSSLAIETVVLEKYGNELDKAISSSKAPLFHMMIWASFTKSIEFFVLSLGFWWGCRLVMNSEISFYALIISFMGVYFSGQSMAQLFGYASSISKANTAMSYYFWLLGLEPEIKVDKDSSQEKPPTNDYHSIDINDVQFSYPQSAQHPVLRNVSLTINRGEFVAFVGASGSGKSTMIALLERFYDPTSGSITIDGNILSDLDTHRYRSGTALVQQEPVLFPGSIRENIVLGLGIEDPHLIEDAQVEAACRAANIWEFVSSLPEGLATPCGASGNQLSGGQRQRIAIARALMRNPRVILLDEATSALDTESEKLVQEALLGAAAEDRITIAVAHRLSTIQHARRIFVFHRGHIIEFGSHSELIQRGGLYKQMCEAQER